MGRRVRPKKFYRTMKENNDLFPDGTPIDEWFFKTDVPALKTLGKQYVITEYGVFDDGNIYTQALQTLINRIHQDGGGVMVVPAGTYCTGALFFKQGVHLYIAEGGVLKGSDDVADYPVLPTRIEGENCEYLPALINADGLDGFVMCGEGTVDGNGLRAWKAFWNRRKWNPNCTNKDEQRARLIYLSHCKNVLIAGLHLNNSQFWTSHIYKCSRVKFIGCHIFSPREPVASPSTDAIDIDACSDVLVKHCYMEVNDDAISLKGGKGPWADESQDNGINERILIEDCRYGFCHSGLTCGSESVHNKNILVRRIQADNLWQLMHFKLRPDTPQHYEYITVQDVEGTLTGSFLNINPWTQFFDLKGRTDKPVSKVEHITIKNCTAACEIFFNVSRKKDDYELIDFSLENLQIRVNNQENNFDAVEGISLHGVDIK